MSSEIEIIDSVGNDVIESTSAERTKLSYEIKNGYGACPKANR